MTLHFKDDDSQWKLKKNLIYRHNFKQSEVKHKLLNS